MSGISEHLLTNPSIFVQIVVLCVSYFKYIYRSYIYFYNCVIWALNADWLTDVVYQTVHDGYDKTFICIALYVGNQFLIAIRHLRGLWYMVNIRNVSCIRTALSHGILVNICELFFLHIYRSWFIWELHHKTFPCKSTALYCHQSCKLNTVILFTAEML